MGEKSIIFFFILDTSENMKGARIDALNNAMKETKEALLLLSKYNDVGKVKIAVLEYNTSSNWITKSGPEDLEEFEWNDLEADGVGNIGAALQELNNKLNEYVSYDENDFMPIFIFFASDCVSDYYKIDLSNLQNNIWFKYGTKIGFSTGNNEYATAMLAEIVSNVEAVIDNTDLELFKRLMRFIPMKDVLDEKIINHHKEMKENYLMEGMEFKTFYGNEYEICKLLNQCGQKYIYLVKNKVGELKVLKYYKRTYFLNAECEYWNIKNKIIQGAPCKEFEWPLDIIKWEDEAFGYIIDLRPEGYYGLTEYMLCHVRFKSFQIVTDAALNIVLAFRKLHSIGYSYQELHEDIFKINPENGNVLICDNENIVLDRTENGIMAKPRYMAPEIVLGKSKNNSLSDRHSMSLILFILFCMNHPLEGKRYLIPALTTTLQEKLYGSEPLFMMDPNDNSNAPHPVIHKNTIAIWSRLPDYVKEIFTRAFSQKAFQKPEARPKEIEWLKVMTRFRSEIISCSCGNEIFLRQGDCCKCEECGRNIDILYKIILSEYSIPAIKGTRIYGCQIGMIDYDKILMPIAQILKKRDSEMLGIKNKSTYNWQFKDEKGDSKIVKPNEVIPIDRNFEFTVDGIEWIKVEKTKME